VAISNSASPEIIWGLGGLEQDHQLHHCCWTGRVGKRAEEEECNIAPESVHHELCLQEICTDVRTTE